MKWGGGVDSICIGTQSGAVMVALPVLGDRRRIRQNLLGGHMIDTVSTRPLDESQGLSWTFSDEYTIIPADVSCTFATGSSPISPISMMNVSFVSFVLS